MDVYNDANLQKTIKNAERIIKDTLSPPHMTEAIHRWVGVHWLGRMSFMCLSKPCNKWSNITRCTGNGS